MKRELIISSGIRIEFSQEEVKIIRNMLKTIETTINDIPLTDESFVRIYSEMLKMKLFVRSLTEEIIIDEKLK